MRTVDKIKHPIYNATLEETKFILAYEGHFLQEFNDKGFPSELISVAFLPVGVSIKYHVEPKKKVYKLNISWHNYLLWKEEILDRIEAYKTQ